MIEIPTSTVVFCLIMLPLIGFLTGVCICVWFDERSSR
jgi:hypothetical protein